MNRINQNVKYLREYNSKTKIWVAERIGKTETAVRSYETGKSTPPYPVLVKYAEAFDVYIGDIIGQDMWKGESRPPESGEQLKVIERIQREKELLHQAVDRSEAAYAALRARLESLTVGLEPIDPDHPLYGRLQEMLEDIKSQ